MVNAEGVYRGSERWVPASGSGSDQSGTGGEREGGPGEGGTGPAGLGSLADGPGEEGAATSDQVEGPTGVTKARTSTTDPQARVMKMPDGGFRPAYNVELATDGDHGVIVGVGVTTAGTDAGHSAPMEEHVEERTSSASPFLSHGRRLHQGRHQPGAPPVRLPRREEGI